MKEDHSLNNSKDKNDTDSGKKQVTNVFTQTEVDTSASTKVSSEHNLSTPHQIFSKL